MCKKFQQFESLYNLMFSKDIYLILGSGQKRKIITYTRGEITVLDRVALGAVSCQSYRNDKDTYQRIMDKVWRLANRPSAHEAV